LTENHAKDLIDPFMIKIATTTIATENLWHLIAHHKTSSVRREISIVHHRGSIAHRQPSITHRGLKEHRHASTLRSWVGSCYGERGREKELRRAEGVERESKREKEFQLLAFE
jgi:hypothetical protein